jgi:hypothetical protein
MHTKFVRKSDGKRSLGKLGVGRRIILKLIYKKECEDADWTHVT